jgi:hypothetical protein
VGSIRVLDEVVGKVLVVVGVVLFQIEQDTGEEARKAA